jgi:pimeloyl-ACP methyl ester carboxylesterase
MLHDAAAALGVRVVAVDRPGFGRTPFDASQPHTLASWAGCVRHLADQLGVRTFAVLGASGGAPFAAAAARFAPPGRVTGLGLLCPLGPPAAGAVAARDAALLALARTWPRAARTLWRIGRLWLRWDEAAMSRLAQHPADRAAFAAAPAAAATIRAAVLEGLHSGGWGVVHEMALVQRCWGFALSDITVPRAFVWHGLAVRARTHSQQQMQSDVLHQHPPPSRTHTHQLMHACTYRRQRWPQMAASPPAGPLGASGHGACIRVHPWVPRQLL